MSLSISKLSWSDILSLEFYKLMDLVCRGEVADKKN